MYAQIVIKYKFFLLLFINNFNSHQYWKCPTRYDGEGAHVFVDPKSYYRHTFFKILDWLIGHLKTRVKEKAPQILYNIERLFSSAWSGAVISQDDLEIVCQHFGADLDRNRLACQLSTLENMRESGSKHTSLKEILSTIGNSQLKVMIPQVCHYLISLLFVM